MSQTTLQQLAAFGQSIWLDNINRTMLETGKLGEMITQGLRGMTSNPTIFEKAISKSNVYDKAIEALGRNSLSIFEIYDELTIQDIQQAADTFKPVYERTQGLDGYVSLEINPQLAFDIDETIKEGVRLHEKVNRPNLMLKVPATNEGFKAVEEFIGRGMNVNTTLIFSVEQYEKTTYAYIAGLKRLLKNKGNLSAVRSVASVFISRVDTNVDNTLSKLAEEEADQKRIELFHSLKGKAAVANSHLIYKKFLDILSSGDFEKLRTQGAPIQRVLWASTSTKNSNYSDIKYVTELIARNTVNTLPENTLQAFLDHGVVEEALTADAIEAQQVVDSLKKVGIDINAVCAQLLRDGVAAFVKSFESLLNSIEEKTRSVCAQ